MRMVRDVSVEPTCSMNVLPGNPQPSERLELWVNDGHRSVVRMEQFVSQVLRVVKLRNRVARWKEIHLGCPVWARTVVHFVEEGNIFIDNVCKTKVCEAIFVTFDQQRTVCNLVFFFIFNPGNFLHTQSNQRSTLKVEM